MKSMLAMVITVLLAAGAQGAGAQAYPSKPVRWIIDFPAGGLSDLLARSVGQKLTESWGQSIVYDARPGANGIIAYELAAKAAPDGYTLAFLSTPFSLNVNIYPKLPYDTRRGFAPITLIAVYPNLLVTHARAPMKTVQEFIALAKSKPGGLTYASVGVGSSPHLAAELLKKALGVQAVHVPYTGSGPALTDLIGGRVDFMFVNPLAAMPHVRAGRLTVLGVAGAQRSPVLPEVPTLIEAGLAGFVSVGYAGAAAPARTPAAVIAKVNAEMVRALGMADVRERIQNLGGEPRHSTPEEFGRFLQQEIERWAPVIRESGARADG